jgi:hypothetical protein
MVQTILGVRHCCTALWVLKDADAALAEKGTRAELHTTIGFARRSRCNLQSLFRVLLCRHYDTTRFFCNTNNYPIPKHVFPKYVFPKILKVDRDKGPISFISVDGWPYSLSLITRDCDV